MKDLANATQWGRAYCDGIFAIPFTPFREEIFNRKTYVSFTKRVKMKND
jgi:hypothetical protein